MAEKQKCAVLPAEILSVICAQLALLQKAGIRLEEGAALLARDAGDKDVRSALDALSARLRTGESLSGAMERQGAFPGYLVRMVEIGQAAGRLDEVLDSLSEYYRREAETDSAVRRAVFYPAVMAALLCVVFFLLLTRVLPVFGQVFEELGVALSPAARGLLLAGEAGKYAGGALAVLLAAAAALFLLFSRRAGGRALEARLLGRGAAGRAVDRSRFASAMALMLRSGLPLDEAAERAGGLLEGSSLAEGMARCREAMERGTDFPAAVAGCGLLTDLQAGLLSAGFRAGRPERAMEELASRCAEEAGDRLSRRLSRLEFALVALLCAAVGLVLLSVMTPLLGVLSAIG